MNRLQHGPSPRVRGTATTIHSTASMFPGPSPRVRGTAPVWIDRVQGGRSIPACAGNRWICSPVSVGCAVHPRVCGEQSGATLTMEPVTGPSPRVRGTDQPLAHLHLMRTVHPRVCGEQRCSCLAPPDDDRSIPACAGNSPSRIDSLFPMAVHPRVCGEQP